MKNHLKYNVWHLKDLSHQVPLFSTVQFSHSVVSDSLRPHELQHARSPCLPPTPGAYSNSCPSSQWCCPAISSSVIPFSSCPQSLPASGTFPMSQLFSWGGQSIAVSASASVLPMNTQILLINYVTCSQLMVTADGDCSHEIKIHSPLRRKVVTNLDSILKSRDVTLLTKVHIQSYDFSSSHVWMWELDHKEGWVLKNWCFWTLVLEKTLESPLGCKIKPVDPKGNQSWIFTGRTDAEAEAPILWPPDVKTWLIRKDLNAGKDWRQEENGTTEDKMVGWPQWLNGHEFEQALGDGEGRQGSLACYSSWGLKESDTTEWLYNSIF